MKLTAENASEFIGKQLTGGLFHYWPLTVKQIGSKYYTVDRNGVMMQVDDSDPVYFNHAEVI